MKLQENYFVLSPKEYLQDVVIQLPQAKKRVYFQTMYCEVGKTTNLLIASLRKNRNKIDKRFHVDWFGLLTKKATMQKKIDLYSTFSTLGFRVLFTNPPLFLLRYIPYFGRNHMKITIIDDAAYIGGINVSDLDSPIQDFMVKITHPPLVEAIAKVFLAIDKNALVDSNSAIDGHTNVLVDKGGLGKSLIYSSVLSALRTTKQELFHVSQFIPDGAMLSELFALTKKGIKVTVVVPKENRFSGTFSLLYWITFWAMKLRRKEIPLVFTDVPIHMKVTIIDRKRVFFGSHNLSQIGIASCAAELMIDTQEKELLVKMNRFVTTIQGYAE